MRGPESSRDFLRKIGLALKQLNESEVWLDMILGGRVTGEEKTMQIRQECNELCRILAASVRTTAAKPGEFALLNDRQ